jgi:hypothetical protein
MAEFKFTEGNIQKLLSRRLLDKGHNGIIPNSKSITGFEADLVSYTNSGLLIEYEIKCSRSDLKKEVRKHRKGIEGNLGIDGPHGVRRRDTKATKHHTYFCNASNHRSHLERPNRYYLVTPEGLIDGVEIPDEWGLYRVAEPNFDKCHNLYVQSNRCIEKVEKAPKINDEKPKIDWKGLVRLMTHRICRGDRINAS